MILTGHQPNYLPYLGFFHKIAHADAYLVVDTVQFVKRGPFGWIHRNKIRTKDGWMWLSVPVKTHDRFHQSIAEAEIDNVGPWRRKHWKSIALWYAKAPHFAEHRGFFEELYSREWTHLSPLCEEIIRYLIRAFGLTAEVHRLSDMKATGRATDLIVSFCKELGAGSYVSGIHGKDYLDQAAFDRAGIELVFQEFAHPTYAQCQGGEFVEGMAAIDLLFNAGPRSREILVGTPGAHSPSPALTREPGWVDKRGERKDPTP